jgi:hypothetical protein
MNFYTIDSCHIFANSTARGFGVEDGWGFNINVLKTIY